jgi:hypothetical protein
MCEVVSLVTDYFCSYERFMAVPLGIEGERQMCLLKHIVSSNRSLTPLLVRH